MTESEFIDTFEDFFSTIDDPRLDRSKLYLLEEILFLVLIATLAGVEGWKSIEYFGQQQIDLLRDFYSYANGIPSDDTIRRLFRRLGHRSFQAVFKDWVKTFDLPERIAIAIDGKTSKSSIKKSGGFLHTVTAYASEHRLVLGQQKTNEKSNEITAIPKLLDVLSIKNAIVTIDAMGCQKDICKKILAKEADYCIAVKNNQPSLYQDIVQLFDSTKDKKIKVQKSEEKDQGHGRIEKRICEVIQCPEDFLKQHGSEWIGIKMLVKITSHRTTEGKESVSYRYYISSAKQSPKETNKLIRGHWAIENNLHWVLDTSFNDDESRIISGNAPINMMTIKHFALNLLQKAKTKTESIKMLRGAAGWNKKTLLRILSKISEI
jgi:predicted transposase YbfD/YdcC